MNDVSAPPPRMEIQTANALITGAPATDEQLRAALVHFRLLSDMLSRSGPRFANASRDAAAQHNAAVRRLKESDLERRMRAARQVEKEAGLNEIEV